MSGILRACVIARSGDLGPDRNEKVIRRWCEMNGAVYVDQVDSKTTHLICSVADYRDGATKVLAAEKHEKVQIVKYDWLEDSLLQKRRRGSASYLMENEIKVRRARKMKKKELRKQNLLTGLRKFESNCNDFKRKMNGGGHHIYQDNEGFDYEVTLARLDSSTNTSERYLLKLFETHDEPKMFACYANYTYKLLPPSNQVLAPMASDFETAYKAFVQFFKAKTGFDWDQRWMLIESPPPPRPENPKAAPLFCYLATAQAKAIHQTRKRIQLLPGIQQ